MELGGSEPLSSLLSLPESPKLDVNKKIAISKILNQKYLNKKSGRIIFHKKSSQTQQLLATGKYGCTEVRVYPAECSEQLGRDPSKLGAPDPLFCRGFLGSGHFGTRPCQSPSRFGIRLHFLRPHFPSPKINFIGINLDLISTATGRPLSLR